MAQFTVKSCKIIKVNKIDRTWGGQLGGAGVSQFLFWPQSRLWQFDSSNFGLAFSFKPKLLLLQGHKKKGDFPETKMEAGPNHIRQIPSNFRLASNKYIIFGPFLCSFEMLKAKSY